MCSTPQKNHQTDTPIVTFTLHRLLAELRNNEQPEETSGVM